MSHASDRDGELEYQLECPVCGWFGIVYYVHKPPTYCSDACRAKAYRQRKRDSLLEKGVTLKHRRRHNDVLTVQFEHAITRYLARDQVEAAAAIADLAATVGAPIDWVAIKKGVAR